MNKMIYSDPDNNEFLISCEDIPDLYKKLIGKFPEYWKQGNCSGVFEIFIDNVIQKRLSIGFFEELGLCLTYEDFYDKVIKNRVLRQSKASLAVYDESTLGEVVDIYCELYVSKGLLMPPALAWKGIEYFIRNGEKSDELKWITPYDLPEEGNWC